jgi:hypothetical protein
VVSVFRLPCGDCVQAIAKLDDLIECCIALRARRETIGAFNQQPQLLCQFLQLLDLAWLHFFAFSPSSTRRRNASDRLVSFAVAQASTCTISSVGIREVTWGSRPVAGRPRLFFGVTFIDFFMIFGVTENRAEGKLALPPRL